MTPALPSVLILMCTHNGAQYLSEQLASLVTQSHTDWALWVSDDGSTDATREILADFQTAQAGTHAVTIVDGPQVGAAQNYMRLLTHPDLPLGPETHVALSDQDDVWLKGKLSRALKMLAHHCPHGGPAIYGGQSLHTTAKGQIIGSSRKPTRGVGLRNALVQNMLSGHSIVLNPLALDLVRRAGVPAGIAFHDWWLYLLICAAGGSPIIDNRPVLGYRQHEGNVIGAPGRAMGTLRRAAMALGRTYGGWIATNIAALAHVSVPLTSEANDAISRLQTAPDLSCLHDLGLYRQTRFGQCCLWLAVALGRLKS